MPGKTDLSLLNCSLARALNVLGDWWTLLILREAFFGVRRFSEFRRSLGIARNILSDRLDALLDAGILQREGTPARPLYILTPKGHELLPAMVALMQWGDKWESGGNAPVILTDALGRELPPVLARDLDGNAVTSKTLGFHAGPGADANTRMHIEMCNQ